MKNIAKHQNLSIDTRTFTPWFMVIFLVLFSLFSFNTSFAAASEELPNLTINLVDGTNNNIPMLSTRVDVRELLADGSKKWRKRGNTDATGRVSFFLAELGEGKRYELSAKSTFNKKTKRFLVEASGTHTFQVGTPLLHITLRDSKTETTFPNVLVTAYQIEKGKKDKWLVRKKSDESGKLTLDLPTLSSGAKIRLRVKKVYNNLDAYSSIIDTAGTVDFLLGDVQISVLDIRENQAITQQDVTIYTQSPEGNKKWYGKAKTDDNGLLRLNLKGVNAKNNGDVPTYIFKTRSPFNNKYKYSQTISQIGDYEFQVGTALLNVTLKDASSNNSPIANKEVRAYQTIAGKMKGVGRATTNAQGIASFDIPALLQSGTVVQLRTKVFNKKMWARSGDIKTAGDVDFKLATTVITVKDGSVTNGISLGGLAVSLREIKVDGKSRGIANLITDEQGVLRLTLPAVSEGKSYLLRAKNPSPIVTKYKYSQPISTIGAHDFIVGTELLKVSLLNAITQLPAVGKRLDVYQDRGSEKAKWLGKITTDAQGQGVADIPLLAKSDNTFYLRAKKPYGTSNVYSEKFSSNSFNISFPIGKTPVTLIDKDKNVAISKQRVDAYEKLESGKLKWRAKGITDTQGIVHFDLAQLALGKTHVFRVKSPFGKNKHYYSALIMQEGPVKFSVSIDEDGSLDLKAPSVAISSPTADSQVGATGFELIGTASDNKAIDKITVTLDDGSKQSIHTASFDTGTSNWSLQIAEADISANTNLLVSVTASDKALNKTTISANYVVIEDASPPTVTITSPAEGDNVPRTGFLLKGIASDDTGIVSLHAQVQESSRGSIADRDIDVSESGNWALAINNGQLSEGSDVSINLTATDVAGRQTIVTLNLKVVAVNNEARHMINRITFGATPVLLSEVKVANVDAFLNQQLNPSNIDDSALDAILASNGAPFGANELKLYQLTRMIHSRRQLQEVMAWFWENHFNTDMNKEGNSFEYELAEHNAFRDNALGNFRTLLDISAKSPAMLIYLDSILNISDDANENYAREVMELSTCGVDACYTQDDVESLAEILTGWQVRNDAFFFNTSEHTSGSKVFQGVTIPEGGVAEGNTALDMLARHSATAQYICSKLINVFISDIANAGLNSRCVSTFQASANDDDQITQVLRTLLTSPEFNSSANFNGKVKSPIEFAVGVTRALQAQGDYENLPSYIQRMGIKQFQNPVPTGWSEIGSRWINSSLLQERTRFVNQISIASSNSDTFINPIAFFQVQQLETAEGISSYLFDLLGGDIWSDLERQIALDILNQGGTFDINSATADIQLRELIGTVQSFPEYNYQ